jgi:DNA invertase Pin-like site-specific DNA recombinase
MRVAIYSRVSTDDKDQNPERQVLKCKQYCELHNHTIEHEVLDYHKGDSSPMDRPKFNTIDLKKVDAIVVYSIDRLTRQHPTKVMNLLNYFKQSGILIISVTEPIFNMESDFAEPMQYFMTWWNNYFLKKLSQDVKSGLERAKEKGITLGRPKKDIDYNKVIELKTKGLSLRQIATELNISLGSVQRCIKNPIKKEDEK